MIDPASSTSPVPWWVIACRGCGARVDALSAERPVYLGPLPSGGRPAFLCAGCARDAEAIAAALVHTPPPSPTCIIGSDLAAASVTVPDGPAGPPTAGPSTVPGHNAAGRTFVDPLALAAALAAMAALMDAADALDAADLDGTATHPARRSTFDLVTALGGTLADVYAVAVLPRPWRDRPRILAILYGKVRP